ncbi:MAG: hypothetical protein AAB853_03060, partial [Patescibacteria group bacterium]
VAKVDLVIDQSSVRGDDSQSDTLTVSYGAPHTLRWTSANTTSCTGTNFETDKAKNNTAGVATGGLMSEKYTYTITCNTVSGAVNSSGSLASTVTDTVTVGVNPPTLSCEADKTSAFVNETITWTATPVPSAPPSGLYGFSWSQLTQTYQLAPRYVLSNNPLTVRYSDTGEKKASVTLTAPGSRTATASCPTTPNPAPIVSSPASLTVKTTRNGQSSPGTIITASPSDAEGTTEYTITKNGTLSATLVAPEYDSATARFQSWSGACTGSSCTVSVPINQSKTITAAYQSASGTLSCDNLSVSSNKLTYSYTNTKTPTLWKNGSRMSAPSLSAPARAPTDYTDSGLLSNTAYTYVLRNGTTETSSLLAQASCKTPALPDLTANAPTIAGLPAVSGKTNTYYEGAATLGGSVNNNGDAPVAS